MPWWIIGGGPAVAAIAAKASRPAPKTPAGSNPWSISGEEQAKLLDNARAGMITEKEK